MNTNLERLLLRQEQLTSQIRDLQSREKAKKRKADTRAKILIGASLISLAKKGNQNCIEEIERISNMMSNQRDKDFLRLWLSSNFSQ